MTTFALVHGAWHGQWCWKPLGEKLEARGHRVVAVDLPCEDVSAGCAEYAGVVVRSLEAVDEDVVVVGHSLAGLTIPLVALARPVRRLVYLCALLPEPGRTLIDQDSVFVEGFGSGLRRDELDRSYWPRENAAEGMYPDCSPELAAWAVPQLRRQARKPNVETTPLESWPDVERVYVLGRRDHIVDLDWSRRAACDRLGVAPVELDAGHSPLLMCPRELADLLTSSGPAARPARRRTRG